MEDKMIAAATTYQSCKILSHSIINCCVVFLRVMSLKAHGCSVLLTLDFLDHISSSHQNL